MNYHYENACSSDGAWVRPGMLPNHAVVLSSRRIEDHVTSRWRSAAARVSRSWLVVLPFHASLEHGQPNKWSKFSNMLWLAHCT